MDIINQYIWIVPGILGGFTAILLIYWLWLTVAPGPRPRQPVSAPPPSPMKSKPAPVLETDDTIIDRVPGGGMTTMGSMTVQSGLPGVSTIEFPSSEFRVGRFRDDAQNVLVALDEKSVSRSHALVRGNPQTGEYYVQDIGSRFGTFVVTPQGVEQLHQGETRRIYDGTVVQFGSAVRVRMNLSSGGSFSIPDDFDPGMTRL
ncbi:MAG: FHA domain-containing protein [Anaerolineae bacterium]|nr:FHA domain-containing protein [Anaerolineae bacterium]